jgi:hypothetical protein
MINRNSAKINSFVIHNLGNQSVGTDVEFSKESHLIVDDVLRSTFMNTCLDIFKEPIYYHFNDETLAGNGNMVFHECDEIFTNGSTLYEASINITRHLYNKSINSKIKQSYFTLAHISDLLIEDELVDGILMCKYEIQDSIFNFNKSEDVYELAQLYGYIPAKVDKICLILNTNQEEGYKILNLDKTNSGGDAKYWKEEFLNIKLLGNAYTYTTDFIKVTGNFLKNRKPLDEILGKGEEIAVLSKSADYFKKNKEFDERDYKNEVFEDPRLIDAFDEYKTSWQEKSRRPMAEVFSLDDVALNKQQKVFKSVIKLDKNFHIYVHGDHKKILKGTDEDGRKYYMLYYNEEIE